MSPNAGLTNMWEKQTKTLQTAKTHNSGHYVRSGLSVLINIHGDEGLRKGRRAGEGVFLSVHHRGLDAAPTTTRERVPSTEGAASRGGAGREGSRDTVGPRHTQRPAVVLKDTRVLRGLEEHPTRY